MASPNISFDTLPASIRKPGKYFEFNTRLAVRTLPANKQRVLVVAPKTDGFLAPNTPIDIYSDVEAQKAAGAGSLAHLMCRAAIKAHRYITLSLVVLEDAPAALAATGQISFMGKADAAGVVSLSVGDEVIRLALAAEDSAATAASQLALRINQVQDLPVTAKAEAEVVRLTAKNKGETGNTIALSLDETVDGLSASVTPMSGGQVDADMTAALSAVFADGHNVIVSPYTSPKAMTALRNHLDATGHALEQRGAIGVAALTSTLAKASTLASSINNGRISLALLPGSPSLPCEVAAAYAAVLSSEEDPAMPLNTLPLKGIAVPQVQYRLGRVEQETALYNGVTPLEVGPGEKVQIVRAISTYVKDAQGIDDVSLLDITTIRTLDFVRKACRERISLRFPRTKLSARTAPKVRSELIDVLIKLEELEIVEAVKENLPMLVIERDSQDPNRLNAAIPCDVVNGLHVFAGRIDLLL